MAAVHALLSVAQLLICSSLLNARPVRRRSYQSHFYTAVALNAQYHAQPLSSNLSTLPLKIEVANPSTIDYNSRATASPTGGYQRSLALHCLGEAATAT